MLSNMKLEISPDVYEPLEDSMLIAESLEEKLKEKKYENILEIGCGSGLLSIVAAKHGKVEAVDINPKAAELTRKNAELNNVKINCHESDLFESVKGKFKLIIFNPPYLPDKDNIKGKEMWADDGTISKFIKQSRDFLEKNGEILMIISSLTGLENVKKEFEDNGFEINVIKKQKIPWEELMVLEAKLL